MKIDQWTVETEQKENSITKLLSAMNYSLKVRRDNANNVVGQPSFFYVKKTKNGCSGEFLDVITFVIYLVFKEVISGRVQWILTESVSLTK